MNIARFKMFRRTGMTRTELMVSYVSQKSVSTGLNCRFSINFSNSFVFLNLTFTIVILNVCL